MLAAHKGFFTEEGVDVELIQVNPRLGATAVLNGDIDLTTTFGSTLRGILGGFPLKFVAVSVRKSEHFLIARPEFKDLRELKGKLPPCGVDSVWQRSARCRGNPAR